MLSWRQPPIPSVTTNLAWLLSVFSMAQRSAWWRHDTETLYVLLALCEGIQSVTGGSYYKGPRSFDVFFDVRMNKLLSIYSNWWWFETLCRSCDVPLAGETGLGLSWIIDNDLTLTIKIDHMKHKGFWPQGKFKRPGPPDIQCFTSIIEQLTLAKLSYFAENIDKSTLDSIVMICH